MPKTFDRGGVRLEYPKEWEFEQEEDGESWTLSLQGPGTAFLVVSFVPDIEDPAVLVDAAVEGLRESYPELEAEDAVDDMAGQPALGADVRFEHFDLTNTCWIRSVPAINGAVLVMAQCTDEELSKQGQSLKNIMATMVVDE